MSDDLQRASFRASIPPIMSGIKTGGDGMRVQFDIPESDIAEAAKLLAMRGQVLRELVESKRVPYPKRNDARPVNGDTIATSDAGRFDSDPDA